MRFFHDARLTLAISIALLLGLLVPVGLVGIIRIGDISDTLWQELNGEHERLVNVLSLGMQDPIWNLLPQTGQPLLDAVVLDSRVTAVLVESTLNGRFLSAEFPERRSDPALSRIADVLRNGELIGRIHIEMNTRGLVAQLSLLRNQAIGIAALQVLLSLVIMMFVLRIKVILPLRALVQQLAGNSLDKPFVWRQGDELGDLGRSFEKTRRSLVQLFADLGAGYAAQLESEQRFRTISEAVPVPILITGIDGLKTLFANGYAGEVFGMSSTSSDSMLGAGFADPGDRARLLERMQSGGVVVGDEILMRRGNGSTFWALLSMRPLTYAGERAVLIACIDISERKSAELTVRESEARLRAILRTATDPIISIDESGSILEFNPAAENAFGYRRAEVLGKELASVIIPEHLRIAHAHGMRRYMSSGETTVLGRRIETEGLRKGGEVFPVELAITEVPMSDRRIFTAYLRDITSRRQTDRELAAYRENLEDLVAIRTEALKSAEERLVTAINTFQGGFALFDSDEKLIIANDRMVNLFPHLGPLRAQAEVSLEVVTSVLAESMRQDENWARDQLANYRDGRRFSGEMTLADDRHVEINVSHGSDRSTLFVITDITSHKEATETLHGALERSRDLALLQRDFVSMASHEFRTPLAIIDAMTQRVIRRHATLSSEAIVELGTEIRGAVARMVGLIDAILSSSRLDSGEIAFNPQPFDLAAVLREVCRRQQVLAVQHRIELDIADLPAQVDGDAALIDQALTNLIANAVKYSPSGGKVTVRGWSEGESAKIAITDQGVGIPPAEMPRLFQRFFRARTSTGISGTGLGLYFVDRLMRMHDGGVTVESTEGVGSTFTITLPFYQTARAEASADHDTVH